MISSEVKSVDSNNSFPKLMISSETGKIVLFWENRKGIVVNGGRRAASKIGDFGDCFNMYNFSNFYGTIEITSNI